MLRSIYTQAGQTNSALDIPIAITALKGSPRGAFPSDNRLIRLQRETKTAIWTKKVREAKPIWGAPPQSIFGPCNNASLPIAHVELGS